MTGQTGTGLLTRSVTCDSDLSSKEGYAVNFDTTDDNNVDLAAGATKFPFPLLEGAVGASGAKKTVSIAQGGRVKVKLGGTVAPGDKLTSDGNGKWITTTTAGQHYGAVAQQIGVANDLCEALIIQGMVAGA